MKNMIIISLGCLFCFVGGLYLGVTKVEEQTAKWDVKYKETDDQYDLIEELSGDLDKINNNFNKKIKKIEVGLADIKSDLNKIKNSKMGSKLLGD
jgi:hypothetical protein